MADIKEFRDLREIAARLCHFHTTKPDNVPSGSICYVCLHEFGTLGDEDEEPCVPLQLKPCNHLIGDKCFKKLPGYQKEKCQLCRQGVYKKDNPVPQWFISAVNIDSFWCFYPGGLIPFVHEFEIDLLMNNPKEITGLQTLLFKGLLSSDGAIKLWWKHIYAATWFITFVGIVYIGLLLPRWIVMYNLPRFISSTAFLNNPGSGIFLSCLQGVTAFIALNNIPPEEIDHQNERYKDSLYVILLALLMFGSVEWLFTSIMRCFFSTPASFFVALLGMWASYIWVYAAMAGGLIYQGYRHKARLRLE